MNYYEFKEPYYALIKATDRYEAIDRFMSDVAEIDWDDRINFAGVDRDDALVTYARGLSENKDVIPTSEILYNFNNDESMTLLIDGYLL